MTTKNFNSYYRKLHILVLVFTISYRTSVVTCVCPRLMASILVGQACINGAALSGEKLAWQPSTEGLILHEHLYSLMVSYSIPMLSSVSSEACFRMSPSRMQLISMPFSRRETRLLEAADSARRWSRSAKHSAKSGR